MKNIFVGNLDFNASEEAVRGLFEQYGQVNSARIMTDRDTGRSRGFAFVEMENEAEADRAIQALNGYTLDGRALNVNEARPKPDRGFGGGGGRGGFGGGGGGRPGGGGGGGGRRPGGWRRWRRTARAALVSAFENVAAGRADGSPAPPPATLRGFRFPGTPVAGGCGWGDAVCATPWLQSGGCARASPRSSVPPLRGCARCRPPGRTAS